MKRGLAVLAAGVAATLGLAVTVPASAASWIDTEWTTANAAALACGDADTVDATAWGRMITGALSGQSLDPVAALHGVEVTNLDPATSSTATPAGATDVGDDAWTAQLDLAALGGVEVSTGVPLPFASSTGVVTQYGRATSSGVSVGASGAVTTGGGVATLDTPGPTTPRLGSLRLSTLLDSALPELGVATTELADVGLRIGAVGALAGFDACDSLWAGSAPGAALWRDYLVDDLGLDFRSSLVTDLSATISSTLTSLEATIDGLDYVTNTLPSGLLSALSAVLSLGGGTRTLGVTIDVDLAPVRALLTTPLSDGAVAIDLSTGRISVDLEALFGAAYSSSTGLNGQDPNTPVLTPEVLGAVSTRVGALLTSLLSTTIPNAITTAIDNASVRVDVSVPVLLLGALTLTFQGTIGGFTGVAGHAAPTVGTNLPLGGLLSGVLSTVVPAVVSTVVTPLKALALAAVPAALGPLTSVTLPAFLVELGGVLDVLGALVDVTLNAQPDAANPVGVPDTADPGRYFESALHVGVVNGSGASVASLFLASASVGPNALRR